MKITIPTKKASSDRHLSWILGYEPDITPRTDDITKCFPTAAYDIELYKWHMGVGKYFYQNHLYGWLCKYAPIKPPYYLGVDIGANVGQHSIMMSQMCKRVIAFEPHPETFNVLQRNMDVNNINNVELYQDAISDRIRKAQITDRKMSGSNHIKFDNTRSPSNIMTNVYPLDYFNLKTVHIIKIDVECHELEVLNGMEQTLHYNNPYVILEAHRGRWETPYMFDFMEGNEYFVIAHFQNNIIFHKSSRRHK